jgi:hypothetical protein
MNTEAFESGRKFTSDESRPRGGVNARKYAAMCLALGMARGALHAAIYEPDNDESKDEIKRILNLTATAKIAEALGCGEADLAISWDEHLSPQEKNRIVGFG